MKDLKVPRIVWLNQRFRKRYESNSAVKAIERIVCRRDANAIALIKSFLVQNCVSNATYAHK